MSLSISDFFAARIQSIPTDLPLAVDIYLFVNREPILFRKAGDTITRLRMEELLKHRVKEVLIPNDQKARYLDSLRQISRNDTLKKEIRGKFIKESAFNHIEDIFTKPDVKTLVEDSEVIVKDIVDFVSEDMEAVASLMRLSTHDYYTYNHSVNVGVYTIALCKRIYGEDKDLLIKAGLGGLLHDLGKRRVPIEIINKPGKLSAEEWEEVKNHPAYGKEYLDSLHSISDETKRIVYEHHENIDGTGYPNGLTLDEISKVARIAAIADVFDALTTKRAYKDAVPADKALEIMYSMQPGKFDPSLFKYFDRNLEKKVELAIEKDFDPCDEHDHAKKIKKVS